MLTLCSCHECLQQALVVQEDVFVPTLCARETVQFAARLRLPSTVTAADREKRVAGVLEVMGLSRSADTQVRLRLLEQPHGFSSIA